MKYLKSFREYDMFGSSPTLYIEGKESFGTIFGLIITILALISYFVCGIYFVLEMFDKSNVNSFTSVQNPTKPLAINFTSDKFYFGFAIQDPYTYDFVLDESIYYVTASFKVATRLENGTLDWQTHPVELERCQIDKFNKRYKELFEKRNIQNLYCVSNFSHTIEGTFLHDKYSFLMFDFYQCKNTTENGNKCKPQDKIDYYLNGTFVAVEFTDISLDPSNYSNPDTPILGETYSTVGNNFYREMHIFLKAVKFKSDVGLLFTSIKETDYIQLDYLNDMFALKLRDMFCSFTLKISNRIDVYERTYVKFQTTLANIGGIIEGVSTIGIIITFFYSKTAYELGLTNQIFNVVDGGNYKKVTQFHKTKEIYEFKDNLFFNQEITNENRNTGSSNRPDEPQRRTSTKVSSKTSLSSRDKKSERLSTREENLLKKIKKYKPIRLSIFDLLFSKLFKSCFNKKTKIKLLNKGMSIIIEKLDIISMVKEVFNSMKLRKMLFSKAQSIIFNLNFKPELSLKKEKLDRANLSLGQLTNINTTNVKANKKALEYLNRESEYKIINDSVFLAYIN